MSNIDSQKKIVENLELVLASLIHDGKVELATKLEMVVNWFHKNEPVIAVLEAQSMGVPDNIVQQMKEAFNVLY